MGKMGESRKRSKSSLFAYSQKRHPIISQHICTEKIVPFNYYKHYFLLFLYKRGLKQSLGTACICVSVCFVIILR